MTTPIRIQLRRTRGWRMPPNTIKVARPSRWGNPYSLDTARKLMPNATDAERRRRCVRAFSIWVTDMEDDELKEYLTPLRGKNLACFCALNEMCHADVLLELANREVCHER
jgi:hypothetical protein